MLRGLLVLTVRLKIDVWCNFYWFVLSGLGCIDQSVASFETGVLVTFPRLYTPVVPTAYTPVLPTAYTPVLPTAYTPVLPTVYTPVLPTLYEIKTHKMFHAKYVVIIYLLTLI